MPAAVAVLGVYNRHPPAPLEEAPPPSEEAPPWEEASPREEAPPPPSGQNHRRLWKYNLGPTSLRAVKNCPIIWHVARI